jgi:prepilin-type N-terminal cleavage/methylation domain-containing protein
MAASNERKRRRQAGVTLVELLVVMIVLSIVTTMIISGWISLQSSYAHSVNENDARSTARYALNYASGELRAAQPLSLTTPAQSPFTVAQPMEVDYYSSHDQPGTAADGSGIANLRLTRIYLDTTTGTLYWQRDTNNNGSWDSSDQKVVLASNVVNNSTPNPTVTPATSYTAIFTYVYLDTNGNLATTDTVATANLGTIVSVTVRIMVAASPSHTTTPADLQATVSVRNAPGG